MKKQRKNKLLIRQKEILAARNASGFKFTDAGPRDLAAGKSYGIRPDKGLKGGSCNVTACQEPHSAFYFNKSTEAYYCRRCADEINWPGGRADCMRLYGVPLLCELDEELIDYDRI